ncbi:MAG: hypothetical protein P4L90_00420 [Rhodopila sp.]|nr:hypothetical protein [Rhodopila sp.]
MYTKPSLWLATFLALTSGAVAAPVTLFAPRSVSHALDTARRHDDAGLILAQNRGRSGGGGQRAGGGGGGQRAAAGNRGGNFNSNNFHRDASNVNQNANVNRNTNVNRNANVSANRNVNVDGGCCNGNYDSGPNWGGVAAGVAVGAVVGAAASSAAQSPTYAAPPPTYPPGYVTPPPN